MLCVLASSAASALARPVARPTDVTTTGPLTNEAAQRALRLNMWRLRACLAASRQANPGTSGGILKVRLDIDQQGAVVVPIERFASTLSIELETCAMTQLARILFQSNQPSSLTATLTLR